MKKKIGMILLCMMIVIPLTYIVIQHYQTRDGLCIVGYHNIVLDEVKEEQYADNRYVLSVSQFKRHLQYLYDHQYQTLTMDEVYDYYYGNKEIPKKAIVLTFDDGFKSFDTLVKPLLEQYQFHGTCFVIGKNLMRDGDLFLKAEDIQNDNTVSYYSHSYNLHRKASGFDQKIIETLSLEDINQDFQSNSIDCTYFAFPYGRSVKNIEPILQKNNVKLAFSYNQFRHMTRQDNPYYLPRYMMIDWMPDFYFKWIVE